MVLAKIKGGEGRRLEEGEEKKEKEEKKGGPKVIVVNRVVMTLAVEALQGWYEDERRKKDKKNKRMRRKKKIQSWFSLTDLTDDHNLSVIIDIYYQHIFTDEFVIIDNYWQILQTVGKFIDNYFIKKNLLLITHE